MKISVPDKLLMVGFMGALLPFIALAAFNHPSADDFKLSNHVIRFGFWQTQVDYYMTWVGRYCATALYGVNPLVSRSFWLYKFVPLILFVGLFHAFYKLARELAGSYFDKWKILVAALALLTLYVGEMASVAQGFYWYPGAVTYQVPNILLVYLCACIFRARGILPGKGMILTAVLSAILVLAIAGSNETSMVILLSLLLAMRAWSLYRDRRVNGMLFALVIMSFIGTYFVVTAPGNGVRLAYEQSHRQSILFAMKSSVTQGLLSVFHRVTSLPTLVFTLLFIAPAAQLAEKRIGSGSHLSIHPLLSFGVYIALLAAGFLPGYWSVGGPPARAVNVIHLLVLLGWFFNVYVCVEYGIVKYKAAFIPFPAYAATFMCLVAFLSFLKEGSNMRTAYRDLLSGRAARYDAELTHRYEMFAGSKADYLEVNQLENTPDTIFFDDITVHANNWRNDSYAKYFHKKTIVLAKPEAGS